MKKMMICIISCLAISAQPVLATETQKSDASTQQKTAGDTKSADKTKPADASKKPPPSTKNKTDSKPKSTWNKFTDSVKHGKKSDCTPEQKHLTQCK
jgi:hypothetical protein